MNYSYSNLIENIKKPITGIFLGVWLVLMAGCATNNASMEAPVADNFTSDLYNIGVGDALQVSVWKNPELSMGVPVRPDGMISMPLIGDITASGKTPEILAEDISAALSSFIRTPQVTVIVTNPASSEFELRVRVTGAVNQPTSIPYKKGMTVMDLILSAGGVNEFAAANRAVLYRRSAEGTITSHRVLLRDIFEKGNMETNYPIQPSDVITVPERIF